MNADQLERINQLLASARTHLLGAKLPDWDGEDQEVIHFAVAMAREAVGRADKALFNIYSELHKIRAENYGRPTQPTTTTRVFTIEDL